MEERLNAVSNRGNENARLRRTVGELTLDKQVLAGWPGETAESRTVEARPPRPWEPRALSTWLVAEMPTRHIEHPLALARSGS